MMDGCIFEPALFNGFQLLQEMEIQSLLSKSQAVLSHYILSHYLPTTGLTY